MGLRILLGAAVGGAVGLVSWRGNQTANLVSVFPDGITLIVLVVLLSVAIRVVVHRPSAQDRASAVRAGMTTSSVAGTVFGSFITALGLLRLGAPSETGLAFGFLVAFGSAVTCGALATALWSRGRAIHAA